VTIVNCTFGSNNFRALRILSGPYPVTTRVRLVNSILAYTVGGDNVQGIEDWGHNLSTDNSATNTTTIKNTDPLLGPLTNNGGPTRTMGLRYGSPAIDAADTAAGPGTDQRGVLRPIRGTSDIGAFEGSVNADSRQHGAFCLDEFYGWRSQGTALIQVERTGQAQAPSASPFPQPPAPRRRRRFRADKCCVGFCRR